MVKWLAATLGLESAKFKLPSHHGAGPPPRIVVEYSTSNSLVVLANMCKSAFHQLLLLYDYEKTVFYFFQAFPGPEGPIKGMC